MGLQGHQLLTADNNVFLIGGSLKGNGGLASIYKHHPIFGFYDTEFTLKERRYDFAIVLMIQKRRQKT